jgi:DNA processing protein
MHRDTAIKMLNQGGLLTEYMSQTNPDKGNFVRRNRIVAGMADATIVIESADKGGALITANLAMEYARDVFAFPGRINDEFSTGCNKLIAEQKAALITSAYDFAKAMNWDINRAENAMKQPTLFPVLTEDEEKIWNELSGKTEGITANMLCVSLNLPIHRIISTLSTMITNGWVKQLCGGRYKLLV